MLARSNIDPFASLNFRKNGKRIIEEELPKIAETQRIYFPDKRREDRNYRFHKKVFRLKRKSIKKKIYLLIQRFVHNCSLWENTSVILTKRNIIFILFASQTSVLICYYLGHYMRLYLNTKRCQKSTNINVFSEICTKKGGGGQRYRSSFNDSSFRNKQQMKVKISLESIFQFGLGLRFPKS